MTDQEHATAIGEIAGRLKAAIDAAAADGLDAEVIAAGGPAGGDTIVRARVKRVVTIAVPVGGGA